GHAELDALEDALRVFGEARPERGALRVAGEQHPPPRLHTHLGEGGDGRRVELRERRGRAAEGRLGGRARARRRGGGAPRCVAAGVLALPPSRARARGDGGRGGGGGCRAATTTA